MISTDTHFFSSQAKNQIVYCERFFIRVVLKLQSKHSALNTTVQLLLIASVFDQMVDFASWKSL